jgi:Mn-dependent DtxR family transcriptional regulator
MKRLIYYKRLFAYRRQQSASERIVYSFLVYNAICERDDVWDKETGKYNQDVVQSFDDYLQIPIYFLNERHEVKVNALAKQLGLGKATISRIIEKFKTNGIILHGRYIRHDGIFKDGYFTLSTNEKLRGELLIFYSWLLDLTKEKETKAIYSSMIRLGELYNGKMEEIRDYLQRLKKLGLVERDEHKRLILK